ncbi:MAG: trigger factor [Lachnospiraceae bacterium]|nr:trigger factor [Lachnospiraceae bacterium]
MSVKVEKLEHNMAKLTIEVPTEELEKAVEKVYQSQKKNISIPGFRKGKVPRAMVEKMYGAEVFYQDAANEIIPDAYEAALKEVEEEIVSMPEVDVVQMKKGEPFIFTAEVALKPEVKLGQYKGVEVDKIDVTVSDEEVEAEIEKEREKNARTVEVTDRAVKDGDTVSLDFEGFVDGAAFEGGKGENYPLTIGSGAFIPGFEEQLVGTEIGADVEVNVTFPEDYQADNLAGKAAVFKCKVNEIKEKQLPEVDDEFASEVSAFDTLEAYKADLKQNLEDKKFKEAKSAKTDAVIDAIIASSEMDIPEAMIKTEQRQMLNDFAQRMQMQGLSMEQYFQFTGTTADMLMEQSKPQAEQRIKTSLVIDAIVAAENIEATEEEFAEELKTMAEVYQMEEDKIVETLGEQGKASVMKDIKAKKAAEFVTENAVEK